MAKHSSNQTSGGGSTASAGRHAIGSGHQAGGAQRPVGDILQPLRAARAPHHPVTNPEGRSSNK